MVECLPKGTLVREPIRHVQFGSSYYERGSLWFIVLEIDWVMCENINRLMPKGVGVLVSRLKCNLEEVMITTYRYALSCHTPLPSMPKR